MSCLRQSACVTNAAGMQFRSYAIEYNPSMLLKAEFHPQSVSRAPIARVIEAAGRIILGKETQVRLPPPRPLPPPPPPLRRLPRPGPTTPPPPLPPPPRRPLPPLPPTR